MTKIYCYGNCQAGIVSKYLKEYDNSFDVQFFSIEGCLCKLDSNAVKHADFFIYQHCSEQSIKNLCDHKDVDVHKHSTDYLNTIAQGQIISFPSLYYSAYFTDSVGHAPLPKMPNYTFNNKLWAALLAKKDINELRDIVLNPTTYPATAVITQEKWSYKQLKDREQTNQPTIPMADFLHENLNRVRLMHTTNHPTKHLYQHLLNEILKCLGLPATNLPLEISDYALKDQHVPILASISNALHLAFGDDPPYYAEGKECPTLDDYLRHYQERIAKSEIDKS